MPLTPGSPTHTAPPSPSSAAAARAGAGPSAPPPDAACTPLSINNVARSLPPQGSAHTVLFSPIRGGGQLALCSYARSATSPLPWSVAAPDTVEGSEGTRPDPVEAGRQLLDAWRDVLDQWTYRLAAGLHDDVNGVGAAQAVHTLQWGACLEVARSWLQGGLPQILESTDSTQLFGVEGPLPQPLRDAVLRSLHVEIVALGSLTDHQRAQTNAALGDVYALLRGPAQRALTTEPLLRLFSSLHAQAMTTQR